jgi:hypothetical protein
MVNFRNLADKAKDVVEKRGGSESLKQDAEQLKGIAKGPGSLSEKAKAAVSALKEPGTASQAAEAGKESPGAAEAPTSAPPEAESAKPTPKQAAGKAKADAAKATGTTGGKGNRPPEEVGGAK